MIFALPMFGIKDISRFLRFYRGAKTIYDAHSPLVYDFITSILDTSREYYAFQDIELLREKLLRIDEEIDFQEYGAGSRYRKTSRKTIKEIAKRSATSAYDGRILFNAATQLMPHNIIELGTSLGIGTAYLASANNESKVYTIEGDPASAYMARRNFELLGLENVEVLEGQFEDRLLSLLKKLGSVNMVYIDGNHTYEATINYVNTILPFMAKDSLMILDDIYWSDGMMKAWKKIILHKEVSCSIDIFRKGFLFINNKKIQDQQHHKIIKTRYKPWRIGLFS